MHIEQHGGNIYKKAKELGIPENEILDFSANINPLGIADGVRQAMRDAIDGAINYPDPDSEELREAIAAKDHVSPEAIVCGNGGADLLYRLAYGIAPERVLMPAPTFTEYESAFEAGGAAFQYYEMDEDLQIREDILDKITPDIDLAVVCNPNNPTGILTEKELLLRMVEKAEKVECRVLVDECFLDLCKEGPGCSLIPYIRSCPNLIILKSFTKLYAIPGVRLGYTLCSDKKVNDSMVRAGQAWPVSFIAQKAGTAALALSDYRETVLGLVSKELAYMKEELGRLPVRLYDGRANYLFFRAPGIRDLDRRLEEKGILIRNCSNYRNLGPDYWRVAVKTHEENLKLIRALKEVLPAKTMTGETEEKNG